MNVAVQESPRAGRASPLPPEERRRSILRAVGPVILERGISATTRELAEAAGVAEGTLFRVFDDKATLMRAAVFAALDPASALPDIEAIDRSLPLRDRLLTLVAIGFDRVGSMVRWFALMHEVTRAMPERAEAEAERGRQEWMANQEAGAAAVKAAVIDMLRADAPSFRIPVERVAELFDVVVLGSAMQSGQAMRRGVPPPAHDPADLVDLLLHGVLAPGPVRDRTAPPSAPVLERTS